MNSVIFTEYRPKKQKPFDRLLPVFMELLLISSGDLEETLDWLKELDERHSLTDSAYTLDDFLNELRAKGYMTDKKPGEAGIGSITAKTEQHFRSRALEELFGKLKKGGKGNHSTRHTGPGADEFENLRPYEFGDSPRQIAFTESLKNAWIRTGSGDCGLREEDLEVREQSFQTSAATVLLIDISHSMILYGEDRITPAKKVALALAEFIRRKYPKDSLDIVAFGNDAREISLRDLPYLKVGPFHTNTVAALEAAREILRKRKNPNRQIIMVTDGKPTCLKEPDGSYYKNSFGLDDRIIARTLHLAQDLRKKRIPVTTFMIASDHYLREFVREFTEINGGKAYYTTPDGLGSMLFEDFEKNRKKKL